MDWSALEINGVLARKDIGRIGADDKALARAVRAGELRRLCEGHYTTGPVGTGEEEHLLRTLAHHRANPGTVIAGPSAGLLHGLPLFDVPLAQVHLAREEPQQRRRRQSSPRLVIHPYRGRAIRLRTGGVDDPVPTVPLADAVVHLGALHGPEAFLVAADAGVRLGRLAPAALHDEVCRAAGRQGIGAVRSVLDQVEGRHESPGETRLAFVLRAGGLPAEPQVVIRGEDWMCRVDFLVGDRVVVEFDGLVKYTDRAVLVAEKARQDRLLHLGYQVVRVTWADLANPGAIHLRVRQALERARRSAR